MSKSQNLTAESVSNRSIWTTSDYGQRNSKERNIMISHKEHTEKIAQTFIMRPPTMDDLEQTVDLFEVVSRHIIDASDVTLDDIKNEWTLPKFDLEKSTRIVLDQARKSVGYSNGKIVGYIEVWDVQKVPVDIWVWGRVHPDYEGLGIGSRLMEWAEKRSRQAISRVPDDVQVVMESGTYHQYVPAHALFQALQMEPIRNFLFMATELDKTPTRPIWPANISVRAITGDEEAVAVIRAVRDAFQDHWGYVEQPFEDMYERWTHFMHNREDYDPSLWFLAMDGEEIAGMSLCAPKASEDPDMGWVNTLGVRRPWRRQGIGLALLHHTFAEFHKRGKARVGLGVDAGSLTGATGLYEKAGMRAVAERQFDTYRKILRPGRDISRQEL